MSMLRSLVQSALGAASPTLARKQWFRSHLTEPGASELYSSFVQFCSSYSYSRSQPYPAETTDLMCRWTKWYVGREMCPDFEAFRAIIADGGGTAPETETVVYPDLFNALARATHGMPRVQWANVRTSSEAQAFLARRMQERRQASFAAHAAPDDFTDTSDEWDTEDTGVPFSDLPPFAEVGDGQEVGPTEEDAQRKLNDAVAEINRLLREKPSEPESDPRIAELEEQVQSLEKNNQRLIEAVRMASLPVSEGGSNQRIDQLQQQVRNQTERIGRLQKAGKTVIAQREEWKARAITAEEALAALKSTSSNRDDKVAALRRLIVKELHPDNCASGSLEKAVRQEFFKVIWPKVEELSASESGNP